MRNAQKTIDDFQLDRQEQLVPPAVFYLFALACLVGVILSILLSVIFAPADSPMHHFKEGGTITVFSSISLSMASVLALLIFYLKSAKWSFGNWFWLALSAGTMFFALDERFQFHENVGRFISSTDVGDPQFFRNWNDVIVIIYGLVALMGAWLFGREILKCRAFAIFMAIGFGFYAIHTGIDSTVPSSVPWKDVPEEGAKLFSVVFIFLAVSGQLLAMLEQMAGKYSPRPDS